MLRYAITDAARRYGMAEERRQALPGLVHRWCVEGVEFVQLREKALMAGELFALTETLLAEIARTGAATRLLVNARADVAVAAGAHGVHLTAGAGELTPAQVRAVFAGAGRPAPVVSVSCHLAEDVRRAREAGADLILFGPVFEKVVGSEWAAAGSGLARLREAVAAAGGVPVLALGGVTAGNAAACLETGAAGVAGIRLFGGTDSSPHDRVKLL